MNDREEVEVARLLEDSVGSLSLNDSVANSNSPARCVVLCCVSCVTAVPCRYVRCCVLGR